MTSLLHSRLGDIIQTQNLVTVNYQETVGNTLKKLSEYQLLCAPVVDHNKKLLGFVDVVDIVDFLIPHCTKKLTANRVGGAAWLNEEDIAKLQQKTQDFKMSEVVNAIGMDGAFSLPASSTVLEAIQEYLIGVHRIAVTDERGVPIGLVSQCTLLQKIVEQNDPLLRQWMTQPVKDTPFKSESVETVLDREPTLNALLMMKRRELPDLPIIDSHMKVVGVLSASDVRCLVEGDFTKLLEPVDKFVYDIRRKQNKPHKFCVRCLPHETLGEAVRKMIQNRVHRVILIDERNKPAGVISMTDIMRSALSARKSC